jgi:hypothetical protein
LHDTRTLVIITAVVVKEIQPGKTI